MAAHEPQVAAPAERTAETIGRAALVTADQLTVVKVTGGLSSPLGVTHAEDGSGRLFVVERGGRVRVVKSGAVSRAPSSTSVRRISGRRRAGPARPGVPSRTSRSTASLYVYYTRADGDIIVSTLTANCNEDRREPDDRGRRCCASSTAQIRTTTAVAIAFGPDGYLYIGVGDGGGASDPGNNGQDKHTSCSARSCGSTSITRPGSSHTDYAIPDDNPFVGKTGARRDLGLRHAQPVAHRLRPRQRQPLHRRCRSGPLRGDQPRTERASRAAGTTAGTSWKASTATGHQRLHARPANDILPVAEYSHSLGLLDHRRLRLPRVATATCRACTCSATSAAAASGRWANGSSRSPFAGTRALNISSFGESETGELYLTDLNGALYRVIAPEFKRHRRPPRSSTASTGCSTRASRSAAGAAGTARRQPSRGSRWRSSSCAPSTHPPTDHRLLHRRRGSLRRDLDQRACGRPASRAVAVAPTLYCPTRRVTRAQMAIFLDKELDPAGDDARTSSTDDDGKTGEASINRLAAAGITGGCGTRRYCPTSSVTREQMAGVPEAGARVRA